MHHRDTHKLGGQDRPIRPSFGRPSLPSGQAERFDDCSRETTRKKYMDAHLKKNAKIEGYGLSNEEVA